MRREKFRDVLRPLYNSDIIVEVVVEKAGGLKPLLTHDTVHIKVIYIEVIASVLVHERKGR